jgi:tetratricopeptide (TPR) repeat protein
VAGLALFAALSVSIFVLARRLGIAAPIAFGATAILAVHPLRSEAVHQIVGQAELLAALFMTLGLISHLRDRRAGASIATTAVRQAVFFAAALGSKEHAVLYPLYVALAAWGTAATPSRGRRREVDGVDEVDKAKAANEPSRTKEGRMAEAGRARRTRLALGSAFVFVLAVFLCGKAAVTGGLIEPASSVPFHENPLREASFGIRLPAALGFFASFLRRAVLPIGLSPDYSARSLPVLEGWRWPASWAGAAIAVGLAIAVAMRRRERCPACAWVVAFALAFGFVSNAVLPIGAVAAERLWQTPLTTAALGCAAALAKWTKWTERVEAAAGRAAILALTLAISALLAMTWSYAPAWRSNLDFARRTVEIFPDSWRGNHNLAVESFQARGFETGLLHARRAVELRPEAAQSWDYLGLNAALLGRFEEAERAYFTALELEPDAPIVFEHVARLYLSQGMDEKALPWLEEIVRRSPGASWAGAEIRRIRPPR